MRQPKSIYTSDSLMQLFLQGPVWDGNLISKSGRDDLVAAGLAERWNGWNYLTQEGVEAGLAGGLAARDWHDKRWYKKAALK